MYLLNPCREYWFEVIDRRRLAYLAARGKDQDLYHEQGHPLLASWGQQTQSQLALIVDASDETLIDDAHFSRNPDNSLLARLQNSILDMTPLAPGSVPVADHDRSIEIHVCHSLTREIEVLHDRLLALFAGPDAPALGDILVVTPDLDAAAPLIDAVFGTAPKQRHIPFAITGRARSHVNSAARALLDLLALASSRFTVSSVFGLLQQPAVARRFGLAADDLEQVRAWLQAAGVHWALDAEHRGSLGVPALPRHSLADGMDRLFLGYALPSRTDAPFDGRLPAGDAEGSDTLALGALWQFVDALADLRRKVATPQPATAWAGLLADALADFVAPADHELEDLREVHDVLEGFGAQLGRSGLTERQPLQGLPFEVVRAALAEALDDPARGGVPTGMVTFASMSSLRNIPFKVVCAIGLNDGAFPTHARPLEFDLMSMQPRRGDRQRRIDERNVFLDLLLAARERVHLSYVGRSVRDNSILPPSVLVSELMEYLIPAIANVPASAPADAAAFERARARLRIEHPLQPFSELAFRPGSDIRVRSFQREYAEALTSRLTRPNRLAPAASPGQADDDEVGADEFDDEALADPATRFFAAPLPEPGDEWRDVPLERLIEFFKNPCRYLLQRRLAVELRRDEDELQDDEPFLPDVPGRTALANRLLPLLLDGCDIATARSLALAGTEVPTGAFGRQFLERELAGLHDFAARVIELTREPCLAPHAVSVEVSVGKSIEPRVGHRSCRVHTAFADLRTTGRVRYRYDDRRPTDYITAWLQHLMLCADPPAGVALTTTGLGRDGRFRFKPCADPHGVLQGLVTLYWRGLRAPLYFFPKSAWSYIANNDSVYTAAQAWRVSKHRLHAEGADAAFRLALRGLPDPMGPGFDDFHACAHAVLDPLFACLDESPAP